LNLEKIKDYEQDFLERAKFLTDDNKFLFLNLYNTFKGQVQILKDLKETIDSDGGIIEKEYVKGRPSITVHPAISQYNNTAKSMNNTITTILKMLDRIEKATTKEASIIEKLKGKA